MTPKQLSTYVLSNVHLNKYNSHYKFILMFAEDTNLNPGSITTIHNRNIWHNPRFRKCILSNAWTESQSNFDNDNSNKGNNWTLFGNTGVHFIHLKVNSLLLQIEQVCQLAKLTNVSLIGISETKLDGSFLNDEIRTEG